MGSGSAAAALSTGYALVVSDDPLAIRQLTECLERFALPAEVCGDTAKALQLLNGRKFDAIVVDLKLGEPTRDLLEHIRNSAANRTAVTFAVSAGDGPGNKIEPETNFVLERPLSPDSLDRTLKVAYGMIVRERRRYFRCPVKIPAAVWKNDTEQIRCETVNVSEGGLALSTEVKLRPGAQVGVQFTLPGQMTAITAESEICWYDDKSRAGLQFMALSPGQQAALNGWLGKKLEESLPESVANKFRRMDARRPPR